jgi:DNA repair exonuclease SbcCD ATPase subunit
MDERKNTIKELEDEKRSAREGLVQLEGHLGEMLLERLRQDGASTCWEHLSEYLRLLSEIADSEEYIKRIEADVQRLKVVETAIDGNEQLLAVQSKQLVERHTTLGGEILAEPELIAYSQSYQTELDAIMSKIEELETKLDGLTGKEGEKIGIFSRIGKNVQGLVLRSSLGKNQEQIRKLCEATGENFTLAENPTGNEKLSDLATEVEELRSQKRSFVDELTALKEERGKINETFNKEGNPSRHIKSLEKDITEIHDGIHVLYAKAGRETADAAFADQLDALETSLNDDETALLDKIALARERIQGIETRIASLKAAIAIDEEKEAIARHCMSIEDQRRRIAESKRAIADFEARIGEAQQRIAELSKLL